MKTLPTISIVTPVWNGLPFLSECVESVRSQDFQDWELIISDNCSTDGTLEYLDSLHDPRIKVFKQKKNLGIMGNMNFLMDQARAPVTQILCADDYFTSPKSLQRIVDYWETAPQNLGFARFGHNTESNRKILNMQTQVMPKIIPSGASDIYFFVFWNFPGNLSDVSVRTHLIAEHGYFNLRMPFAGDCDMWSKIGRTYAIGVENDLQVYIRRHENVASNYQGLKGELYVQQVEIYEKIIGSLSNQFDQKLLMEYFNLELFSFHYRNAIKSAIHGRFSYFKTLGKVKSPILWPKWQQFMFCLPFALFNVHQKLTFSLAREIFYKEELEKINIESQIAI